MYLGAESTAREGGPAIAFRDLQRAWELLFLLTRRELKLRYQDTALGFIWSLFKPLLLAGVLFVALKQIVRIDVEDYHLVLLTAIFPWTWFQTSVLVATPSFASNGALIKKVRFPRAVLPLSTITNNGVQFALSLPIVALVVVMSGERPSPVWLIGIPVLGLVQLALMMGVVLFISSLDVFFRDLEHLIEVVLQLWFYVTPVIYPLAIVPERWEIYLRLNPMTPVIEGWRALFMHNTMPAGELWPALLFAAAAVAVGAFTFQRTQGSFADAL